MEIPANTALVTANRRLGFLFLGSDEINAFSEDDIPFLSLVADQIAIALENAVAYGEIREFKEKLAQLRPSPQECKIANRECT